MRSGISGLIFSVGCVFLIVWRVIVRTSLDFVEHL